MYHQPLCPKYIALFGCEAHPTSSLGSQAITDLFADYLDSAADWMHSRVVSRASKTKILEIIGRDKYVKFKDLKAQEGVKEATAIRARKLELQKNLQEGEPDWVLDHPDNPKNEARLSEDEPKH